MVASHVERTAFRFCEMANRDDRIGISEFARGKTWKQQLHDRGCLELSERNEPVGLLMALDYATQMAAYIEQLEAELEEAHIRLMFETRQDYAPALQGEALAQAAIAGFDENEAVIREYLDGNR